MSSFYYLPTKLWLESEMAPQTHVGTLAPQFMVPF